MTYPVRLLKVQQIDYWGTKTKMDARLENSSASHYQVMLSIKKNKIKDLYAILQVSRRHSLKVLALQGTDS